jgi:GTP cyclohydrolase II
MEKDLIVNGMNSYIKRINECEKIYIELLDSIPKGYSKKIFKITDKKMFNKIISTFVTSLNQEKATGNLMKIYDIALHMETKALIIANKGATLYSLTDKYETPHLVRHIGLCVYMPGIGVEYANAGIVGDVYNNPFVLRTESACSPSFLFGSQRCNCHYQWKNVRELSATFNRIKAPKIKNGDAFESWVQQQFKYENGKHIYQNKSNLGFVMLHLDSQNGMGSGYTENEFVFDLSERASLRHRGEYTAEQTYKTTMYGGFTTIGIDGDPRSKGNSIGYKITPVILDFLGVNKKVIMLTNNPLKIKQMENSGYKITRVKFIGAVNIAGATEARERGSEFHHMDIDDHLISFKEDYRRLKKEISRIVRSNAYAS